jgi:hypothetical protein
MSFLISAWVVSRSLQALLIFFFASASRYRRAVFSCLSDVPSELGNGSIKAERCLDLSPV